MSKLYKSIYTRLNVAVAVTICVVSVLVGALLLLPGQSHAAGDAYFTLSPSSGTYTTGATITLQIYETSASADDTNAVQANLSYQTSLLEYESTSVNGPFTIVGHSSGGSGSVEIAIASNTAESGQQKVASVTFKVLSSGSANIGTASGSDIDNTSGTSIWNDVLPSASYSITSPSPPPQNPPPQNPPPQSSGSGSQQSSGASSGGSSGSGSHPTTASNVPKKSTAKKTETKHSELPQTQVSLGSISIRVIDTSNKPVAGAKVALGSLRSTTTDSSGVANFSGVPPGTYQIIVTGQGLKPGNSTVTLKPGQNQLVSLRVKHSSGGFPVTLLIIIIVIILIIVALIFLFRKYGRGGRWKFWQSHNSAMSDSGATMSVGSNNLNHGPIVSPPPSSSTNGLISPTPNSSSSHSSDGFISSTPNSSPAESQQPSTNHSPDELERQTASPILNSPPVESQRSVVRPTDHEPNPKI